MTKKVRLGSLHKQKEAICNGGLIRNPSPRLYCPALRCDKSYATRAGLSRHCGVHVERGELIRYIENPKADLHLQRYKYALPKPNIGNSANNLDAVKQQLERL